MSELRTSATTSMPSKVNAIEKTPSLNVSMALWLMSLIDLVISAFYCSGASNQFRNGGCIEITPSVQFV